MSINKRSRSTTPLSFSGLPPQQSINNSTSNILTGIQNLPSTLLNTIQQVSSASRQNPTAENSSSTSSLSTDFSTRNYSDFMRSLAAKYNNSYSNDTSLIRRNALFESTISSSYDKTPSMAKETSSTPSPTVLQSTSICKDIPVISSASSLQSSLPLSSSETVATTASVVAKQNAQSQIAAAAAAAAAVAASNSSMSSLISSLLSNLPIPSSLIDMSNTQALVTLARAAKEAEMQTLILPSQNHQQCLNLQVSSTSCPNLSLALDQAALFLSPTVIFSAGPQLHNLVENNSTKVASTSIVSVKDKQVLTTTTPLDLSSQPPSAKRYKAESTSITNRKESANVDSLNLFERRISYTASSPSPVSSEKNSIVGSSTVNEPTTTAHSAMTKLYSPTSSTSSTAPLSLLTNCQAQSEEVNSWTIEDVATFVGGIDICADYAQKFRDQCIDGAGLPLLTEDHLVNLLGMKLGPALKLRSLLAKKLGGPCPCATCVAQAQQILALQTSSACGITTTVAGVTTSAGTGIGAEKRDEEEKGKEEDEWEIEESAATKSAKPEGGIKKFITSERDEKEQLLKQQHKKNRQGHHEVICNGRNNLNCLSISATIHGSLKKEDDQSINTGNSNCISKSLSTSENCENNSDIKNAENSEADKNS